MRLTLTCGKHSVNTPSKCAGTSNRIIEYQWDTEERWRYIIEQAKGANGRRESMGWRSVCEARSHSQTDITGNQTLGTGKSRGVAGKGATLAAVVPSCAGQTTSISCPNGNASTEISSARLFAHSNTELGEIHSRSYFVYYSSLRSARMWLYCA